MFNSYVQFLCFLTLNILSCGFGLIKKGAMMLETGEQVRMQIRRGAFSKPTAGVAGGFVQANLVIVPQDVAFDFLLFCQRNPKPCPVIEVLEAGEIEAKITAPGSDIRTDVPRYRIYKAGELVEERDHLMDLWEDGWVSFLLGCSFSFEQALIQAGIDLPYIQATPENRRNVPMFNTNVATVAAGPFSGPLVVSQRWMPPAQVVKAVQVTSRFPGVHGAPVHIGDGAALGIKDPHQPDYGDPWIPENTDAVPLYWACGVTPQAVALASKIPLMITHAPGHMFVTDLRDEALAVL